MLRPLSDHVLILEITEERTVEGVLLPDIAREDMKWGKVISAGPIAAEVEKGNVVAFGPHAGMRIQIEGVELLLMRLGEIKGVVL